MIIVELPGVPVPKARARTGRGGHFFTPAKTRNYELALATPAKCVMGGASRSRARCGSSLRCKRNSLPTARPDADNYLKSAKDALNGIVWKDDAQVVDARVIKVRFQPALQVRNRSHFNISQLPARAKFFHRLL